MPNTGDIKSVGGKSYEWNGRRWVPARAQSDDSGKPSRSDYGSGRSGGKAYAEAVKNYRNGEKSAATPQAPESTSSTGRDEPRTSPTGVPQTGTQTSPRQMTMEDANKILNRGGLKGKGYEVQNPFTSTQLPTSSASLYKGDGSDISYSNELPENMFIQESDLKLSRNAFDAGSGVEYGQNLVQMPASGKIEYEQKAGAPLTVSSGTLKVTEANESAQQPEVNVDMARRRAFLDADSSLAGLKAVQAQKGIVKAGNTFYMNTGNTDEKGNPLLEAIKGKDAKQDVSSYMRGAQGADDLKNKYIDKITNETDDEEENK